jgi:uncharacterized protein DUF2631
MLSILSAHAVHPPRGQSLAARRAVAGPPRPVPGTGSCQNDAVSETQRVNQPGREEAVVRVGDHPVEHERPEDWGWHGEMGKWGRRLTIIPIVILLAYTYGNHEGRMEDIWLVCIAVGMIVVLLWDARRRKNAWRSR